LLLDQFAFREDPIRAAQASIGTIRGMEKLLDRLDLGALTAAQGRQDAFEAQRVVMDALLSTGTTEVSR
jgi:xylose isomerase